MSRISICLVAVVACCAMACRSGESRIREALNRKSGVVRLPGGVTEISGELRIPEGSRDLEIAGGSGTVLRAGRRFRGKAILSCLKCERIRLHDFAIDGNRGALEQPLDTAPPENAFRIFYDNNGLWFDQARALEISNLDLYEITSFAILVSRSSGVRIEHVSVRNSGSHNHKQRNNSTGGIVLEEGSSRFQIRNSTLQNILGNGIWTHSLYTSRRNQDGVIEANRFDTIGRDAIQVGHATRVRVERNAGVRIGYPVEAIDKENEGTPVAIDTAGNVDASTYAGNHFEEIDGKCFDLDGFHDGEVRGNTCLNRGRAEDYAFGHYALVMNDSNPDMHSRNVAIVENEFNGAKFGGLYVIGSAHRIERNRLLNLNLAHCNESGAKFGCGYLKDQPELLESGIYLAAGVKRQDVTRDNVIRENRITGFKMRARCIAAGPRVSLEASTIRDNQCTDVP